MFIINDTPASTVCKSSLRAIARAISGIATLPPMSKVTRLHLFEDLDRGIFCLYPSNEVYVVRYRDTEAYIVTREYATACLASRGTYSTLIHVWREDIAHDGIYYHATIVG